MSFTERPVVFACAGETLLGVLAVPESTGDVAVLVVVGGPQYRAGSHRQFTLSARALAAGGVPVLRFDHRGMGDSTGPPRQFEAVGDDIAAAIDCLQRQLPQVRRVLLWGLCDGASAALLYWQATRDARVRGLCLMNPWVRSDVGLARVQVTHYYTERLRQRDFWIKLATGRVARSALSEAISKARMAWSGAKRDPATAAPVAMTYQQRMAAAWRSFPGPILLVLSGRDLTAKEFMQHAQSDLAWSGALAQANVARHDVDGTDHTFSDASSRASADCLALAWMTHAGFAPAARAPHLETTS